MNYWEERYQKGETGWDAGTITTPLKEYIDQLTDKNLTILIPGAGNGHEFDYLIDNRNTFSLFGNIVKGDFENASTQTIDSIFNGVNRDNNIALNNNSIFSFLNKGAQASFKHLFAEAGHELSADFNYNESTNDNNSLINSTIINQRTIGSGYNKNYTSNIDYERLLKNDVKFEAGIRVNNRSEFNARDQFRNEILVNRTHPLWVKEIHSYIRMINVFLKNIFIYMH